MKHSAKLFWLTLGLMALAWGCFAAYEAVTAVRITGDMEARVKVASAPEEIALDEADRELMEEILNFKTRIEDPERYTDLVLTVFFYDPGKESPRYEIPIYRLSDGTNEFVLHYPDGKAYLADTRTVLRLLTGGAFDPFFSYVTSAPSLRVFCDGTEAELHCTENGWQYRKIDNSIFLDGVLVKDEKTRFDMRHSGSLTGEMSLAPDRTLVEISYGGETVYRSPLEELENFRPGRHGDYRVKVTAEWYDSLDRSYSGTCVYEFDLNCILPVAFWLSGQDIAQGGVLELTAEYVEDPATLSVESRFGSFSFLPLGGERYGALIPIGANWPAGEHELTVSAGEYRETLRFRVMAAERQEPQETEAEMAQHHRAWRSWFADIAAGLENSAGEKYWKGPFIAPVYGSPELAFGTPYVSPDGVDFFADVFDILAREGEGRRQPC